VVKANDKLFVINPNSNAAVTKGLADALAPLAHPDGPSIQCVTLDEGPPGIESQRDVEAVLVPLLRRARELERDAAAFVIACFSDPAIDALRAQSRRPVFGIGECGVLSALTLGQRVGIVAILPASVERHRAYFGRLGLMDHIAAELPIGMTVAQLSDDQRTFERLVDVGTTLRDSHDADVLVFGCAGMAAYRRGVEAVLGIPVVEPTQATVAMAIGRLRIGENDSIKHEQNLVRHDTRASVGPAPPRRAPL
jgi:Asp/Glu/hydantoin racemase